MIFIHNFHKFPGKRFLFPVLLLTLVLTGCGKDKAVGKLPCKHDAVLKICRPSTMRSISWIQMMKKR